MVHAAWHLYLRIGDGGRDSAGDPAHADGVPVRRAADLQAICHGKEDAHNWREGSIRPQPLLPSPPSQAKDISAGLCRL